MQKARGQAFPLRGIALPLLVGGWFQVLFHSPSRGSFHGFRSRYLSTIGHRGVLSLGQWAARIHATFHGNGITWETSRGRSLAFRLQAFHLLWSAIPSASARRGLCNSSASSQGCTEAPATPDGKRLRAITPVRFGLVPFRSPLLRKSLRFPFLQVLRCFSSLGMASATYGLSRGFRGMTPGGFSHSETHGSKPANGSPWISLFGGVLHRLSVPKTSAIHP
jgi:hypothetical protein